MLNVILASLPVAIVVVFGAYLLSKRRKISMTDYRELPQPSQDSSKK